MIAKTSVYDELLAHVDELTDQEMIDLSKYIQVMLVSREHIKKYDAAKDPAISGEGLFEGPGDLSDRVEEILYDDIRHSAYAETPKDESKR